MPLAWDKRALGTATSVTSSTGSLCVLAGGMSPLSLDVLFHTPVQPLEPPV